MWTPRPVRPLRYAGSVATSVLPSPVAISASLPSWRTMPPISWTLKGRMPTVRRAASRARAFLAGGGAGRPLDGDPRTTRAGSFTHAHVVLGTRGDRRQVGHEDHRATRRDRRELLRDDRRNASADARVHLVEDHRGHAVRLRQDGRQPERRPRELTSGRHACERPHLLTGIGREAELDPLEPPGRHVLALRSFQLDPEPGALHAERA